MSQQTEPMKYDPVDGMMNPHPEMADEYREYHGNVAWMYNPWTGMERDPRDIGSDVLGQAIVP